MPQYPITLTIAGSDSGGGAGIQADIKTFSAFRTFATSVVTAVTAQNTSSVRSVQVIELDIIEDQIRAVFEDMPVAAVKVGMLGNERVIQTVARLIKEYRPPVLVVDPVMVAKSGDHLLEKTAIAELKRSLLPLATVITPNIPEAYALLNYDSHTDIAAEILAKELGLLAPSVLLKGGHAATAQCQDVLRHKGQEYVYKHERLSTPHTHGTGCTLSSAIAALCAHSIPLPEAVSQACDYVHEAIRHGQFMNIGHGHGPLNHFHEFWNTDQITS